MDIGTKKKTVAFCGFPGTKEFIEEYINNSSKSNCYIVLVGL